MTAACRRYTAVGGVLLLGVVLGLGGCSKTVNPWPPGKSPRVLASFPPLYCFAVNLVGDEAAVLSLLTTVGPHDYQLTPNDAIKVQGAELFVALGLKLDNDFTSRLKNSSGNTRLRYAELGEALPRSQRLKMAEHQHGHGHEHGHHGHSHGEHDPHIWLGIPEAIVLVEQLRDELKKLDAARAADYDRRAAAYIDRLKKLHAEGKELLAPIKQDDRKLVTMHESLGYFARAFDLHIVGSIQPRAGTDLDGPQLAKLVEVCKKQNVRVVAIEPQYPETAAETLRKEVRQKGGLELKTITLDPLETATPDELTADFYEKKMRQNLQNLAEALR